MSSSPTIRIRTGAGTQKKRDHRRGKRRDAVSQAQRGAALEFVRTAGPKDVARMLARREAKGEIVANDDLSADNRHLEFDEAADIELDLQDEDLTPLEVWQHPSGGDMNAVELGRDSDLDGIPPSDDYWELIVSDGACRFQSSEWAWKYDTTNQSHREELGEIALHSKVFRNLAEWLNCNRAGFLRSRDPWDLGPATLEEAERYCAVLQKHLPLLLGMPSVSEETFSRFLPQCKLVWPDANVYLPVQFLFSQQARRAWVARAVVLFARKFPSGPLKERVEKHRNTKTRRQRAIGASRGRLSIGATTLEEFIREVSKIADAPWEAVLSQYEQRMIREDEHAEKS